MTTLIPHHVNAIIWDWNGTILNDTGLTVEVMNRLLTKYGYPTIPLSKYADEFSLPLKDYYDRIGVDTSEPFFSNFLTEYAEEFYRRQHECDLHDHVTDIFDAFQQRGLKQCILSASFQDGLDRVIDHFQIRHYFESVKGLDHHYSTSKVENGHQMMKDHQLAPSTVLMIGDTLHDLEVAEALGIDCVLVSHGHQSFANLSTHHVKVLESLEAILRQIDLSNAE